MNKEELYIKWIEGTISEAELIQFKALPEYNSYVEIESHVQYFKAPKVDKESQYQEFLHQIDGKKTKKTIVRQLNPFIRIAAMVVIALGIYFTFFQEKQTIMETQFAESTTFDLPDASFVRLNAGSTLKYNSKKWNDNRKVHLSGEAYFKVAKGQTFTVETSRGLVKVLGTEFNVNNRKGLFSTQCYEGSVLVSIKNKEYILKPGEKVSVINGRLETGTIKIDSPNWTRGISSFESTPFIYVLKEFERQYNVKITIENVDKEKLYTGSFTHSNVQLALKSITQPFKLSYDLNGNSINISKYD